MKPTARREFFLQQGTATSCFVATERRMVSLIGSGKHAFLWIGNEDAPQHCYATMSGQTTLRKLARAILDTVPEPTPRTRK